MVETVLTIEEAAAHLGDLVERLHARQEVAVITRSGQPLVRIVPITTSAGSSEDLIEFLRRWRSEHPEPDEQFERAIETGRPTSQPPRNPWD